MYNRLLLAIILVGLVLRMKGITIPDMATDEAQFALGSSAAQPPLGLWIMQVMQAAFGQTLIGARSTSIILGMLTIPIIFRIARHFMQAEGALTASAIAAIFPSHILYSRLAYLTVPLIFFWAVLLLTYLEAEKRADRNRLVLLFITSTAAMFIKTQGFLLPGLLILGRILKKKTNVIHDPIFWVLSLSLIPIGLHIITSPGILATLAQNSGSTYGIHNLIFRTETLLVLWWNMLPLFLIAIVCSAITLKKTSWPILSILAIGTTIGLVLGPNHAYYSAHLVFWSVPIAMLLVRLMPIHRMGILLALAISTVLMTQPKSGHWNTHADHINDLVRPHKSVVALGNVGHHIRWYMEPIVLVGNTKDLTWWKAPILAFQGADETQIPDHKLVYEDERIRLFLPQTVSLNTVPLLK